MYGEYGRPILLFEAYREWRDDLLLREADARADFPKFLYGFVRQSMWHGYQKVSSPWKRYARKENLVDFRPRRMRGLNGITGIAKVGEDGTYAHMRRTERPSSDLVLDTYGGKYSLNRQAIINDDTNELLNSVPTELGWTMARYFTTSLIAYIESNPTGPDAVTIYHAGTHKNATTAALSEDSAATAVSAMENQTDEDGNKIVVVPETLVVQNMRMELIAKRIFGSPQAGTNLSYSSPAAGTGSDVFDKGTMNPLSGVNMAVLRDPWWTDANDWYLFANPDMVPAFAVGLLNGKEDPFIGLADPTVRNALGSDMDPYTFDFDKIDFKIRHDFGFAPVDFRGTYRSIVT